MRSRQLWTFLTPAALLLGGCTDAPISDDGASFGNPTTGAESSGDDDGSMIDDGGEGSSSDGMVAPGCGNGVIDGDDVCDGLDLGGASCEMLGFETGTLKCTMNCGGFDLTDCGFFECGNGIKEGDEDCDGTVGDETCASIGYDNGLLFCSDDCTYNDYSCGVCGNSQIDYYEDCDIAKPMIDETCQSLGHESGTLSCGRDCLWDESKCQTCGNGVIEGNEACDADDLGGTTCADKLYDSGTLGCLDNCLDFDSSGCGICGNDNVDGDELCDGIDFDGDSCQNQGFDSGTLTCSATCDGIDTASCGMCGNGVADGSEPCDGADLGGQDCASLGLQGGTLACQSSCAYDFSGCDIQGIPFGSDSCFNGLSLTPGILPCDDISATGTNLGLSDDSASQASIGFNFDYCGSSYSQVYVSSNGTLRFGTTLSSLSNTCLSSSSYDDMIAVFWDDLNPSTSGSVRYQTLGSAGSQRFIVQWDTPFYSTGSSSEHIMVRAMLHEGTNQIDLCYEDTTGAAGDAGNLGASATVGTRVSSTDFVEFSCSAPNVTDGLQLMFIPN